MPAVRRALFCPTLIAAAMATTMLSLSIASAAAPADAVASAVARIQAHNTQRAVKGLPSIPASAYVDAVGGEIQVGVEKVDGNRARKSWGVAVVPVSIDRMWAAINDEHIQVEYTPLRYMERLKGAHCEPGRVLLQVLDVNVPMVADRYWMTERRPTAPLSSATDGQVMELTWDAVEHPIQSEAAKKAIEGAVLTGFTTGSWLLSKVDDQHTLVEYYVWADPGGNVDPAMMSWFAGKSVRKTISAMELASKAPQLACLP